MGLFKWMEERAKKMRWWDFSVLKLSLFAFGLWIAIVWPPVLSLPTWIYFVVFIVGWVYLFWKLFR